LLIAFQLQLDRCNISSWC